MRLAIITDDYLPSSTLVHAKMLHELALQLCAEGHTPVIITPGSVKQGKRLKIDCVGDVTVWRFRNGKTRGVNKVVRTVNETLLSFNAWWAIRSEVELHPFDGIIYYSPSIFFGLLVKKIKSKNKCSSYLILRDSFPQWAIDQALIKEGSLIDRYFRFFEMLNYKAADAIGLMSPENLRLFDRTNDNRFNTHVLYNWADVQPPKPQLEQFNLRSRLGLNDEIVFFYGGNIGHAQDMANLMRLALSFKYNAQVHFLFVGQGDEVELIKKFIDRESLVNVTFLPSVSQDEFKQLLKQVDVGLFSLSYSHKSHNFPGKLLGYMIESLPILGSVNPGNDLQEIFTEAAAGHIFINGEDDKLSTAALDIVTNDALRNEMGKNARNLLTSSFTVKSASNTIIECLRLPH